MASIQEGQQHDSWPEMATECLSIETKILNFRKFSDSDKYEIPFKNYIFIFMWEKYPKRSAKKQLLTKVPLRTTKNLPVSFPNVDGFLFFCHVKERLGGERKEVFRSGVLKKVTETQFQ